MVECLTSSYCAGRSSNTGEDAHRLTHPAKVLRLAILAGDMSRFCPSYKGIYIALDRQEVLNYNLSTSEAQGLN